MTIKLLSTIALSIAMSFSVTACSEKKPKDTAGDAKTESDTEKNSETIVLRFSHFWPASSPLHKEFFEPWSKNVEEKSGGRLKVEIYPSAQLSKPNVTYEAAVKGAIDIGAQAHGYTAGRFPLTQIAELPGLSSSSAQMSCIVQTLYENGTIASEYKDSHLLMVFGAGPGVLHTSKKLIKTPEDMKGLRIRRPSAVAGDIIESMGASPVGLPATDIYTSMQRGVVDGLSFPWDPFKAFKINEVATKHTNIPFYSSALLVTMNKDKYEGLPDDLKKIIDESTGRKWAMQIAAIQDKYDKIAFEEAKAKGDEMVDIPDPLNDPNWAEPLKAGTQKYLNSVKELKLDADGVYAKAQEASVACKSEYPQS